MTTLVLGSNGQLGRALVVAAPDRAEVIGLDLPELDITDAVALLDYCREAKPTVIINAAAYTAVDQAETETELATAVNVEGARNVAAAASNISARLIHISTDFVFDGKAATPYKPDAKTNPLSVYGRTKREGEQAILEAMPSTAAVMRTAWLYSKLGGNFVKTMLRLMGERDELGIVADQIGTPTWAESLATAVWALAEAEQCSGIYHWTDGGETTWYEFAEAIQDEALSLDLLNNSIPIRAITSDSYPTAAARPSYSVLDCSSTCAALRLHPAEWRVNLRRMLKGLTN